jgi:hypothetical protein
MRWWILSRAEARDLVRDHVAGQGLPFTEPVHVTRRPLGGWWVTTNAGSRGGNVVAYVTRRGRVTGGNSLTPR